MSDSTTNNNGNRGSSTAQSYLDSAVGTVQSAFGSLTGQTGDQRAGDAKQQHGRDENAASHETIKVPGATASPSTGTVTRDNPDRATGSWNQTMGAAKEAVGGLVGSEGLRNAGREQNRAGQEQEARGQASDYVGGAVDRAKGAVGGGVANVFGNPDAEAEYRKQHDVGKTQQRGAEHDIQKQADAERAQREQARRE
ncbi:mismatched base pair and cruciform DNA recognition [Niveomyces insectorum RCEF 264]|uniref:Mismatched base pair and cruciform DNA recognition n=1 Tax=Niveomyces insectorum RCEF 264 TaxID=1081102 RepID=A0A167Q7H6_9HYPO|nr:mismatched base pair and cruciform DNA recognition [Niveomyces insectorum RCEF 264]